MQMEDFKLRPTVLIIALLVVMILAFKACNFVRDDLSKAKIGEILRPIRAAIAAQEVNEVLRCQADATIKISLEQLVANDVTTAGPCANIQMPESEKRFYPASKIPPNPFNNEKAVALCLKCSGPCDPGCLKWAAMQYAGWCFDPENEKFWPASNREAECSL